MNIENSYKLEKKTNIFVTKKNKGYNRKIRRVRMIGVWFRQDLRLTDNTALLEAMNQNEQIMGIFHVNPKQFKVGTKNHESFFKACHHFFEVSKEVGFPIHLLYGEIESEFKQLIELFPELTSIYFNQSERGYGKRRDEAMCQLFASQGIKSYHYQDSHLHGADEIKKADGCAFKMFTPYFNVWIKQKKPLFQQIDSQNLAEKSVDETSRMFFEERKNKFTGLCANFSADSKEEYGAKAARKRCHYFIEHHLAEYDTKRDFPALDGTSKLSRFLRTGELSIRELYYRVIQDGQDSKGKDTFIKELCWRDFYNMIYAENPSQQTVEIQEKYRGLQWNQNDQLFEAWKKGKTGFPIVDAAMRQLNQTGWMHNRLRMIVASFLTKDLLLDWRLGERYFSEQLVDYDPASNIGGWQWAASTGTDAVPYFRIFNPTTQGKKFDTQGAFVREYVPELSKVESKYIHEPAKMTREVQENSGCIIGKDYPAPIVDHKEMRQLALDLFGKQ